MKRILLLIIIVLAGLWIAGYQPVVNGVDQIIGRARALPPVPTDMATIQERSHGFWASLTNWYEAQGTLVQWLLGAPVVILVLFFVLSIVAWVYRLIRSFMSGLRDAMD